MAVPLLAGKYKLLRRLAAGGMAEVFLACQTGLDGFEKLVVIKRILPSLAEDEMFVGMFLDEARTVADLRHRNVVGIQEVAGDHGFYMVMEYLSGQNLRAIQERQKPDLIPLEHALFIIHEIAAGLDYVHRKKDIRGKPLGIIHRDVTPENIIVTYDGSVKIIDFGIAKAATQRWQTHAGVVKGKVAYMSPEQVTGQPLDARTDQFSLGVILYEITTNQRLFKYGNTRKAAEAIVEGRIPDPREAVGRYPDRLWEIVSTALAPDADARFESCGALARALTDFAASSGLALDALGVSHFMEDLFGDESEASIGDLDVGALLTGPETLDEPTRTQPAPDRDAAPPPGETAVTRQTASFDVLEEPQSLDADTHEQPVVQPEEQDIGDLDELTADTEEQEAVRGAQTHEQPIAPMLVDSPDPLLVGGTHIGPRPDGTLIVGGTEVGARPEFTVSGRLMTNVTGIFPPGRLVGRAADIRELTQALREGHRLLSIVGPAGVGKSRIAVEFGRLARTHFTRGDVGGGVWLVDMSQARTLDDVCGRMAKVLGVALHGRSSMDMVLEIGEALAVRGRTLMIIDRFEHLLEQAPLSLGRWLEIAEGVRFLVTTQQRLRLPAERVHVLRPLRVPDGQSRPESSEGVRLFMDRARDVRSDIPADPETISVIAEIVRQLDGVPLAIELAAARMKDTSPQSLLDRLAGGAELLGALEGEQTNGRSALRAALGWSWEILEPWEQSAMSQLSVFTGPVTLEAAQRVVKLDAFESAPWVPDVIASLCEKSFLQPEVVDEVATHRFTMYDSVRAFAREQLQDEEGGEPVWDRYTDHLLEMGEQWSEQAHAEGGGSGLEHLARERENLTAVLTGALEQDPPDLASATTALRAVNALFPLLMAREPLARHLDLLNRALGISELHGVDPIARATTILSRGLVHRAMGLVREAIADLEEALAHARNYGDARLQGRATAYLATVAWQRGDHEEAARLYEDALRLHRAAGDVRNEGMTLGLTGIVQQEEGRLDEACDSYVRALEVLRSAGDHASEGVFTSRLGVIYHLCGHYDDALASCHEALRIQRELGNTRYCAIDLGNIGLLHHARRHYEDAAEAYSQALSLAEHVGDSQLESRIQCHLGLLHQEKGDLKRARSHFVKGLTAAQQDTSGMRVLLLACLAVNRASEGAIDGAESMFDAASRLLKTGNPRAQHLFELYRGHLDVARSRAQAAVGQSKQAAVHWNAARERLAVAATPEEGRAPIIERSLEVFLAHRLLQNAVPATPPT